ncbi:MAG: carbohydrate binding family 9 domain-containing protein, partial [Gammaproteobacteria bacterium]|nr:carbohydrate binding family 9 domain-containing protein [Gammaproteobacteria bacterium]
MKAEDTPVDFQQYEPKAEIARIAGSEAPKIDGDISDPVWSKATRIDKFYQIIPVRGAEPSEITVVYMAYDENNLYFAFDCRVSQPDKILATVMQRDRELWQDDNIRVYLDPYDSSRDAMAFLVNSLGTQMDLLIENNSNFYTEWDTIWDVEARRMDNGWTAEMAIPFRSISYNP